MSSTTGPGKSRAVAGPKRNPPQPVETASFILRVAAGVPGPAGEHLAALFQDQPENVLAELDATAAVVSIGTGDILVADDTETNVLGYVLSGMLAMEKTLQDGRRHIIGLLSAGDMFGRVFEGPASFAVRALNAVQVLQFDRDRFEDILYENPSLERRFLVDLLDELDAAREWLLLAGSGSARERVASFLLILLRRHSRNALLGHKRKTPSLTIDLPISRKDMSCLLGMRSETLSRAIHALEASGAIRMITPYRFELVNMAVLAAIVGRNEEDLEL